MKTLICAILLFGFLSTAAFSQNYIDEIMEHVIDPCYRFGIKNSELTKLLKPEEALSLMKKLNKKSIDGAINSILKVSVGKDLEQRKLIYKFGLAACINGMKKRKQ